MNQVLEQVWETTGAVFGGILTGFEKGLTRLFGSSNERIIKQLRQRIIRINQLEPRYQAMSDQELRAQTDLFRKRLAAGETLDDILPEAFAVCREGGVRWLGMRHYDVQLMGGMVLHSGAIAEMVTGEGKTLTATLPVYLNALEGRGVHVVTVNDYLARRDMEWMGPLYLNLGLTVAAIQSNMSPSERQLAYQRDITYGTNNEFGFDYLRDNIQPRIAARGDNRFRPYEQQAQGPLNFAIVDEVDNILIDEARTPLIISGGVQRNLGRYKDADRIARGLKKDTHFEVKEKEHSVVLTDEGVRQAERLAGVETFYSAGNMEWPHLLDNALKAHHLYKKDVNYVVENDEVVIVDEFTGRKMPGRQWSDGLHQAVECKEGVKIKEETETLATVTLQNFFKLYRKLAGMTGTAMTEAGEFYKIYKLEVVAVPTNRELQRQIYPDVIFANEQAKWDAILEEIEHINKWDILDVRSEKKNEIEELVGKITGENEESLTIQLSSSNKKQTLPKERIEHISRRGRPVLVGTASIEKSEHLADLLNRKGIKHEVLNAKNHEREAEIVAQAGRRGAVTIATNMAGRGTDIVLGGNAETLAWAQLKDRYPTRLDVPKEEWDALVHQIETQQHMKTEGREVAAMGGLHVIGTERHEARRIDLQLIGRCGRQGDPGSARFYLSLEDDLMRIFMGDRLRHLVGSQLGNEALESRMVSRRVQGAQKKVEERNFAVRKSLLEYDEVMDEQRKRTYGARQRVLDGESTREMVLEMIDQQIDKRVVDYLDPNFGPKSFASFASHPDRYGIPLKPELFRHMSFEEANREAHDFAERQAEQMVFDAVEENLPEEDPEEWNWDALARWAQARFGIGVKQHELKKIGREKVDEFLLHKVQELLHKVDLSAGAPLLAPDLGLQTVCEWASHQFQTPIQPKDIYQGDPQDAEPAQIQSALKELAHATYTRREEEFPVIFGLSRASVREGAAIRLDKDRLLAWANPRLNAGLTEEDVRNKQRGEIRELLLQKAREHQARAADAFQTASQKVQEIFGSVELVDDEQPESNSRKKRGPLRRAPTASVAAQEDQLQALSQWLDDNFGVRFVAEELGRLTERKLRNRLREVIEGHYFPEIRYAERLLLVETLDESWKTHLQSMEYLRSAVAFRGYGQVDPKVEYKREGMRVFEEMWDNIRERVTTTFFRMEVVAPPEERPEPTRYHDDLQARHDEAGSALADMTAASEDGEPTTNSDEDASKVETIRNFSKTPGRNEKCWCGSGKKYKQCCEPLVRRGETPKWGNKPQKAG